MSFFSWEFMNRVYFLFLLQEMNSFADSFSCQKRPENHLQDGVVVVTLNSSLLIFDDSVFLSVRPVVCISAILSSR